MKLFSASLVIVSAFFAFTVSTVLATDDLGFDMLDELEPDLVKDPTPFFFTLGAAGGGCIGLKHGTAKHGDRLLLRSCERDDESILWTIDENSRFRSKVNMTQCMQVGEKNAPAVADSPLRMVECGRADALQQFDLTEFLDDLSGLVKVASNPQLCVVHKGPGADIDKDIIFLKKCEILGEERSQGWEVNFPQEGPHDAFTFGAPGGGCIGLRDGSVLRGTPLFLVNCSLTDDSILWVKDDEDRFRSKVDLTMCIQNGVTGSVIENGTSLRIVPCGVSELQYFDISLVNSVDNVEGLAGPIKPWGSPELCVVHRGPIATIGLDPILLKPCSSLIEAGDKRFQGWNISFL